MRCSRCVALLLDVLHKPRPVSRVELCERFCLSPAEAMVAAYLSEGLSPAGVAQALGRSLPTVRTHLRRIMEKTGSDDLRKLQQMLAQLPRAGAAA